MLKPVALSMLLSFFTAAANTSSGQAVMVSPLVDSATSNFEVVSVKRSDPKQEIQILNALLTYPGGRIVARGATLEFLIMEAFSMQSFQIVGGPRWMREARFEIEAKPPSKVAAKYARVPSPKFPPPDELRQMLRNLLIERFQLKLRFDQSEGQLYELDKGHGRLHLTPSKDINEYPWAGSLEGGSPNGDGLSGKNISMSGLASRISSWLSTPVVDKTSLSGAYDFEVVVDDDKDSSALDVQNNVLESIKELGLDLKKGKGLIPRLVIEQASLPTAN